MANVRGGSAVYAVICLNFAMYDIFFLSVFVNLPGMAYQWRQLGFGHSELSRDNYYRVSGTIVC